MDHMIEKSIWNSLKDLKLPGTCNSSSWEHYSIKLNKSLYGPKQSRHMWYNRLSEYLSKERNKSDPICPCTFIRQSEKNEFVIIAIYVDNINIIGTPGKLPKAVNYLKK